MIVVRVDFGGIDIVERHLGTLYTACTGLTGKLGASFPIILIPKSRVVLTGILELFGESEPALLVDSDTLPVRSISDLALASFVR